jgi:hypothetical protein
MSLTLRRIAWSDGTSRPDDYNIIHGDQIVGRMYRMNSTGRELWLLSLSETQTRTY